MKNSSISKTLSRAEKIGQLFFPAAYIHDSPEGIRHLEKLIQDYHVGGLCFFHSRKLVETNFEEKALKGSEKDSYHRLKELIQHYQSLAKHPLLISIDAEWGLAMRVDNLKPYPYALSLGATQKSDLAYECAYAIGQELKEAGVHLNLAPVLDVNDNPANPVIGYRSFGANPQQVSQMALAYYQGLKDAGILACMKHFPGHGNTSVDSHLGLPQIDKTKAELYSTELYPFIQAIQAGVECLMPGHLSVPALNEGRREASSLSPIILKGLLREELGFRGAIMSDALNMKSIAQSFEKAGELELAVLEAGIDLLCFSEQVPEAIALIQQHFDPESLEDRYQNLAKLKKQAFQNQAIAPKPLKLEQSQSLKLKIAQASLTLLKASPPSLKPASKVLALSLFKSLEESIFLQKISPHSDFDFLGLEDANQADFTAILSPDEPWDEVLLALYVPHIRPAQSFGMSSAFLQFIYEISQQYPLRLYLFGNPYALDTLKLAASQEIVLAYQDLPEFETAAAHFFLGEDSAPGCLPVSLVKDI